MTCATFFEAQAERSPHAVAIAGKHGITTYRQLNERANRVARRLHELGAGPEIGVASLVPRGLELVLAMLAVAKAGATYIPLDPDLPDLRLEFMLADSGARILLVSGRLGPRSATPGVRTLDLSDDGHGVEPEESRDSPRTAGERNLAYVAYTSGSTGHPKGVLVEYAGLTSLIDSLPTLYGLTAHDRVLLFPPPLFDMWMFDAWLAFAAGATLVVPPEHELVPGEALWRTLIDYEISIAILPASILGALGTPRPGRALRTVIVGGEPLAPDVARDWFREVELHNAYGPTEATMSCTDHQVTSVDAKTPRVSIGTPAAAARLYVLDPLTLDPCPPGEAGELCIGGPGVARAYANAPSLTAARFMPDPYSDVPGARLYRTGDMACSHPDGSLDFLGRTDDQVKLRGQRIELAEIESVLAAHSSVSRCVAHVRGTGADAQLVAYVVPSADDLAPAVLRSFAADRLPRFMVPSAIVGLDALPLTDRGKVDREALPTPADVATASGQFIPPRTPTEQLVASIVGDVLDEDAVGAMDDFFDLGGDSLTAMQVALRLRAIRGRDVSVRSIFAHPVVAELASALERSERTGR